MDRVFAISDTVNTAVHALALAAASNGSISASKAAKELDVSPSYFAKILQKLAAYELLVPTRGKRGGYSLSRPAETISCLDVLLALEGEFPKRECLFQHSICRKKTCALRILCEDTSANLRYALENTTIAAVARSF